MSTEEGNFLISVFNGWTYKDVAEFIKDPTSSELHNYHEDWNKLMPVVEKISLIPYPKDKGWHKEDYEEMMAYPYPRTFGMRNKEGQFMVRLNANPLFEADTLIQATWLAVVDFIKNS